MIPGEDIARTTHIRCELIDLVEGPVENASDRQGIPEISQHEMIGSIGGIVVVLEIHSAHPTAFCFQPMHEVAANEPPGPADKHSLHGSGPLSSQCQVGCKAIKLPGGSDGSPCDPAATP